MPLDTHALCPASNHPNTSNNNVGKTTQIVTATPAATAKTSPPTTATKTTSNQKKIRHLKGASYQYLQHLSRNIPFPPALPNTPRTIPTTLGCCCINGQPRCAVGGHRSMQMLCSTRERGAPVPPPIPQVTNTMSAPSTTSPTRRRWQTAHGDAKRKVATRSAKRNEAARNGIRQRETERGDDAKRENTVTRHGTRNTATRNGTMATRHGTERDRRRHGRGGDVMTGN